jgi:hypothetical protein
VLDILVTSQRDATAATRFFCKLLRRLRSVPRVLITDKLASYGVAHRRLIPSVEHRRSKYLNNRAETPTPFGVVDGDQLFQAADRLHSGRTSIGTGTYVEAVRAGQ